MSLSNSLTRLHILTYISDLHILTSNRSVCIWLQMKMDRNTVLSGNMSNTEDNFRKVFKYYKKKSPPPNLQDVLDMNIVNSEKVSIYDHFS